MVRVPDYQQTISLRPALRQDIDVRATPEAFGSDIGRGMQGLAKGIDNVGDSIAAVKELEDVTRAKEADNAYAKWARERQYGENGFMTLEGKNAVDGRAAFEREAEEKRKEFGQGLTPGAAKAYQTASQARLNSVLQSSITHTASARKTWFAEASTARVETFANDALVNFNRPDQVNKNIAAGILEIREQGALKGWDADTLKQREAEFSSGVHKNITLRIAQGDPLAAEKYMKDNAGRMTGAHQYELQKSLETEIKDAHSKRYAAEWTGRAAGTSAQPGGITFNMIAGFEGFREQTYWDMNHHRVGFGSDTVTLPDGSVVTTRQGMTVSREDAARDLNRRIGVHQRNIIASVGPEKWNSLSAPAQAAVTSVAYNYGSLPFAVGNAIATGGPAEIAAAIRGLAGHNNGVNTGRRDREADAVATGNVNAAARQAQDYFTGLEGYLAGIKDPDVQDRTRRRINAALEVQNKANEARERAAKAELWKYVDQGQTPDTVPMEIRQAAGMAAVSSAWGYIETVKKGRSVESDETLLYDMRRYAASDPAGFAAEDLNNYRGKLSKDAIKELTGLQTTALTDQRKAREEGLNLTTAFSQATQQLEAVGITATGKKGEAAAKENARIAQFQNALAAEMDAHKRANKDRPPTQLEIQSMINKLLLPVVIKTPGMLLDSTEKKRLFESSARPDNATVDVTVKYSDIPIDLRRGIATDLQRELGRKPSEEEIITRYERVVLER
ncbi:MAG: hypothetical protein KYX69_19655 [Sphingomonas sp.]|uniref:hypothetical protein n=1 Tax=Sphingomonas sp. TaxID=28214 RepID=UPI00261DF627|nr:hypothetical protein [Sphingomonas sp.]MDK2769920.1 hypothetical protein [Sphingomonas sp.]